MMNRRRFLQTLGAASVAGTQFGLGGSALSAMGADSSGYKALVCVFLFGGLDNHDFLLPVDAGAYADYARLRQTLLNIQGQSRARESLLALAPMNTTLGSASWALPPEMPTLKSLFDAGELSLVSNVGPLIEPVTRQSFEDQSALLPPRLFSHNDQQATWQASAPEGAQFGWGGLFADALVSESAGTEALAFSTISSVGGGPFLTGRQAFPYQISPAGAAQVYLLDELAETDLAGGLKAHFRGDNFMSQKLIRSDMARAFSNAFTTNDAYNAAKAGAAVINTPFPEDELSAQLRAVAETISIRNELGVSRQIFFVGMGGYDTHSAQARSLPALLGTVDSAVGAFNAAMKELGVHDQVTLFSTSEFGRTLAVNGDGTDHGWGGHHFVTGGAVQGRQLLGSVPPPTYGHDWDSGGGRLIPGLSVEQFAAPLGLWFGLNNDELAAALPALNNFNNEVLPVFNQG